MPEGARCGRDEGRGGIVRAAVGPGKWRDWRDSERRGL